MKKTSLAVAALLTTLATAPVVSVSYAADQAGTHHSCKGCKKHCKCKGHHHKKGHKHHKGSHHCKGKECKGNAGSNNNMMQNNAGKTETKSGMGCCGGAAPQ